MEHAASTVQEAFGPIDVWVNNAMLSVFCPVKEITAEEYRRVTEVTYLGHVHDTLAACGECCPAIAARSSRSAPRLRTERSRCNLRTARRSMRSLVTESRLSELIHDGSKVHVTVVHLPAD